MPACPVTRRRRSSTCQRWRSSLVPARAGQGRVVAARVCRRSRCSARPGRCPGSPTTAARPAALVTATDGNHGRARGPDRRARGGCPPASTCPTACIRRRSRRSRREGATVTQVAGDYDAAVARAAEDAADPMPHSFKTRAWPGYEEIPGWIVEGYDTMFLEIDVQLAARATAGPGRRPGRRRLPAPRPPSPTTADGRRSAPALMSVEPDTAACVLASLSRASSPRVADRKHDHGRAELRHPVASGLAGAAERTDAACAVTDAQAATAARGSGRCGVAAGPAPPPRSPALARSPR